MDTCSLVFELWAYTLFYNAQAKRDPSCLKLSYQQWNKSSEFRHVDYSDINWLLTVQVKFVDEPFHKYHKG
jgi:hypothetical protein